jgi:hypothetical protein
MWCMWGRLLRVWPIVPSQTRQHSGRRAAGVDAWMDGWMEAPAGRPLSFSALLVAKQGDYRQHRQRRQHRQHSQQRVALARPTAPHIRSRPRAWLDWRSLLRPHKAPTYTRSLPAKLLPIAAEPTSLLLYSHVTTRPHGSALSTSILLLLCPLAASSVAAAPAASAAPLPATSALRPSPLQHPLRHRQAPICIHMQCHALAQGQKLGCSWPAPSVKLTTPLITQSPTVANSRRRLRDRSRGTPQHVMHSLLLPTHAPHQASSSTTTFNSTHLISFLTPSLTFKFKSIPKL